MIRPADDEIEAAWSLHMDHCNAAEIAAFYGKRCEWAEWVLELGRAMFGFVPLRPQP